MAAIYNSIVNYPTHMVSRCFCCLALSGTVAAKKLLLSPRTFVFYPP